MYSLATCNGLSVTPEPSVSGGKTMNDNFKALSTAQKAADPGTWNDSTLEREDRERGHY